MTISREDLEAGRVDFSDIAGPDTIPPIHPGETLREDWLGPLGVGPYELAKSIGVPVNRVTEILAGKRAISADTALRLGRYFGTDAQSWINLQARYDLETARRALGDRIAAEVKPRVA